MPAIRWRRSELASRIGLVGGLLVGAITAWRSVLGDFHWVADGLGGLLLAFVVLVVAFAACRTYFDRRFTDHADVDRSDRS